ncbi:MAG: hypothetical protein U0T73_01425 [Chitinophagales bacterium]
MLLFYCSFPLLWLLSKLPFRVLIGLSDFLSFLLEHLIRYRRNVVEANLRKAFPNESDASLKNIRSQFYTHLADRIFETIKMITVTKEELLKRVTFLNPELATNFLKQGRSVIAVMGHCGSWEMACLAASAYLPDLYLYSVYTPVNNHSFNNFFKEVRSRFGMHLFSMKEMIPMLRNGFGEPAIGMYVADQGHSNPRRAYWRQFLNQDTNFMTGPARFCKAHDAAFIYVQILQTERMKYRIHPILLSESPQRFSEEQLTDMFVEELTNQIKKSPADWLWSHKRWKHHR